jgi:hypothetical protein
MWTKFHQKYIDIMDTTYVDKISSKIYRHNGHDLRGQNFTKNI